MRQLDLDTNIRAKLAQSILATLEKVAQGSVAQLRGSLAEGRADPYSDIDVFWEIPDELFQTSVDEIAATLGNVRKVINIRSAPEFQRSDGRRLIFVEYENIPLFWRVDIDIFTRSVHRDYEYDLHNEAARGNDWSLAHSALMNAVAAIKAILRHQDETATQLLRRGYERVGLATPAGNSPELILVLIRSIAEMDPAQSELAQRITELHQEVFGQAGAA
jgi:predicted nucleotidyltransferase